MEQGQERQEEQPALPDMELINFIEGMSAEERVDFKRRMLAEISDRESLCNLVDQVFAGEGLETPEILY